MSKLFSGPYSLGVQASRVLVELSSIGSSFLPHEGRDLGPCSCMVITMQVLGHWAYFSSDTLPSAPAASAHSPLYFSALS